MSTRGQKPPYDRQHYRGRNRIERFFNKMKIFRRIATRYDNLRQSFLAALHLVAVFLIIRNSWTLPGENPPVLIFAPS
jgi:putative transposase